MNSKYYLNGGDEPGWAEIWKIDTDWQLPGGGGAQDEPDQPVEGKEPYGPSSVRIVKKSRGLDVKLVLARSNGPGVSAPGLPIYNIGSCFQNSLSHCHNI